MKLPSLSRPAALALGAAACLSCYGLLVGGYHLAYAGRVFPGVRLDSGLPLGGKDRATVLEQTEQARQALAPSIEPLRLTQAGTEAAVPFPIAPFIRIDGARLWDAAETQGRGWNDPRSYAPFILRLVRPDIPVAEALAIDEPSLQAALQEAAIANGWNQEARPARFILVNTPNGAEQPTVAVEPSIDGRTFDLAATKRAILQAVADRRPAATVALAFVPTRPTAPSTDALAPLLPQARRWLGQPIRLTSEGQAPLVLDPNTLSSLIDVRANADGAYALVLDEARAARFFAEQPLTHLQEPRDGSLAVNASGTITDIQLPTRGQKLDLAQTLANIRQALDGDVREAKLAIETTYGRFAGETAERLGIRDFLGVGASEFSGSPTNRRKNIALGSRRVHGSLVAPDTDFSLLHTLGAIDGAHGWLPELVIKGNKTLPEFGGGLCQVGTTIFRAALNAGMPITERRNHSYRVRYYEPAGTDATIYDPAPDFRFKNDTAGTILVTQDFGKDDMRFLIWGTKDGRVASSSKPVVTDIIAPPPKKIVETTELPPGQTKCTETAHSGATASFDYEVRYPNGEIKAQTFRSVYKPWQAVCLVGVTGVPTPSSGTEVDETGLNSSG